MWILLSNIAMKGLGIAVAPFHVVLLIDQWAKSKDSTACRAIMDKVFGRKFEIYILYWQFF